MPGLIMFTRNLLCSDQIAVRNCLSELNVKPIERNISIDQDAAQMLMDWVGSLSVPTLVVTDAHDQPIEPPRRLAPGQPARNIDRGSLISEPTCVSLQSFLTKHGFIHNHDQSSNH